LIFHPRSKARELHSFARQVRTLALADRLDRQPVEKTRQRQLKLLRWILGYAYENVPYYHRSFDREGLRPGDVRKLEDLSKVPVLRKSQVLGNYPGDIVARGHTRGGSFKCRSSGTSGVRGEFLSNWANRDENYAFLYRLRSWFGYRPNRIECVFAFFEAKKHWYQKLGFIKKYDILMSKEPEEVIQELISISPDDIWGVPTYIHYVASRTDSLPVPLLFALSSGELLDPIARKEITEKFNCPVVDFYGAAEAPYISSECPAQEGQHVNVLNTIIEITEDGEELAPGEMGSVTLTTLTNTAMPLIRYDIGDAATMSPEECSCGRHGPMLTSIEGRDDDFVKTPRGKKPPMMARLAVYHPNVRGYRITQESLDRVAIQAIGDLDEETRSTITEKMRATLENPDLEVLFEEVDELRPDPSGKRRIVVCNA
jgi:phenylacetate-CoA ligase